MAGLNTSDPSSAKRKRAPGPSSSTSRAISKTPKNRGADSSAKSSRQRRPSTNSALISRSGEGSTNYSTSPTGLSSELEPDYILAEIEHEQPSGADSGLSGEATIPQDLIHRLLHHNFEDKDKMNINASAKELVCKYVEIFTREALARSAYMKQEAEGAKDGGDDGFLEVEDLEKCAPLLVLDF